MTFFFFSFRFLFLFSLQFRLFQTKKYQHHYPKEMDDLRRELWGVK